MFIYHPLTEQNSIIWVSVICSSLILSFQVNNNIFLAKAVAMELGSQVCT